ncbi:DUF423 domain-containing protein [Sabulicella rubraurantiaca]|uniref:DUF423 domain-containing protein n=1 Tax=Sabulicella rubraurantiaca TaxID=2811429 RepID=UPI001A972D92|nr:DUF423 domain-containing protein [Sabulicella rubraurantiaca]
MPRILVTLAGISGFLAVMLAALSAHGAEETRVRTGQVATLLGWHAPAFLALAAWGRGGAAAALWGVGLLLFGGAVLLRAHAGVSLGPVAPTGGIAMMLGWASLLVLAWRR